MADTTTTIVGNLTDTPELRFTPNGAPVANAGFRAAVSALSSGEVEAESAACPPGDGGVGGEVGAAQDG